MRHLSFPALLATACLACAGPVAAAPGDDIGATVRIVNLVTGEYETDKRDLAKGDPVRQDELIEVSSDGIGEIRLNDDTELALGPGARLKLDEFVYDPDISGGAIIVNLVEGAFRFITGIAAKPAYVIRTPTASVTVRGTIFDVYVQRSGVSWLLLIEGAIQACSEGGECKELDEPGKLLRITPDGVVSDPRIWPDLPTGDLKFATAFPFIVTPPMVDPERVFTPEQIVDGKVPDGPPDDGDDNEDDDNGRDGDHDGDVGPEPPDRGPPLACWHGWKEVPRGWHEHGWYVKKRWRGHRVIRCAHPAGPHGGGHHKKKECLKKGWAWVGGICIPKFGKCKKGYGGKWPNCHKIIKPKTCPPGWSGKPPHCKPAFKKPIFKTCPNGTVGKWPHCHKARHKKSNTLNDLKKALEKLKKKNH